MGNFVRTMLFVYMEFISCELFVGIFAEKRKERSFWFTGIAYSAACCFDAIMVQLLREHQIFKILSVCGFMTLFMYTRYKIPIVKCLLAVCGYTSIMLACDLVFMKGWEQVILWRWKSSEYREVYITLITVVAKLVEFLLFAWLSKKFLHDRGFGGLDGKGWTKFLIFNLFTIAVLIIMWTDDGCGDFTVLVISFGLMMLNVLFYFTMWDIVKKERQNQEYCLMQEKALGQIKLYQNMETAYEEQRKRTHEFKNHLGCVQGLLEERKMEDALVYLNSVQQRLDKSESPVKTGNSIVDTIVNIKYHQAVKDGITVVMNLDKLQNFPLEDEDTVILLSNLFDNALEACRKLEEKKDRIIKLKLVRRKGNYVLMVSNRTGEPVKIKEQLAETTKKDKVEHGIGMRNIRDVLEKYHAESECKYDDGWFTYTIVL